MNTQEKLIDVDQLIGAKNPQLAKWLPACAIRYLKRIVHQDEINAFIEKNRDVYDLAFCERIVEFFQVKISVSGIEHIPKEGGVIIAMNHPMGGMDAIAFMTAIRRHRSDVRFLVNDILMNLDNLKGLFVGVNKHGKNAISARQIISQAFKDEDVMCIFPAGLVSRKKNGKIEDLEWKKTFVHYAEKYNQPIVPVYIEGRLSNFFYRLSNLRTFLGIKANIEMLYLADEFFRQKGQSISFTIGEPIYSQQLGTHRSQREKAALVKEIVYSLQKEHVNGKNH